MTVPSRRILLFMLSVWLIAGGTVLVLALTGPGPGRDPQERWSGTIDLHQGDKGTIEFTRTGALIEGKIEETRRQLGPSGRRGDDRTATQIRTVKNEWLAEWMPRLTSDEVPINPYRVVWDLQQALADRPVIVTHDAGNPRDQMTPFWVAREPNSYIGWGRSTHLGYSLPLALGAKVARPEATVVHVLGNAAFRQCGM